MGSGRVRVHLSRPAGRLSTRVRKPLFAIALVALVGMNVVAFHDLFSTNADASRMRRQQTVTALETRLHREQLGTIGSDADATAASLATRTDERDQLRASVGSAVAQLAAARVDLGAAAAHLATQVGQVTTLTTCLQGVSSAMNGLSVGDAARGLGALRAVEDPCSRAAATGTGG